MYTLKARSPSFVVQDWCFNDVSNGKVSCRIEQREFF